MRFHGKNGGSLCRHACRATKGGRNGGGQKPLRERDRFVKQCVCVKLQPKDHRSATKMEDMTSHSFWGKLLLLYEVRVVPLVLLVASCKLGLLCVVVIFSQLLNLPREIPRPHGR